MFIHFYSSHFSTVYYTHASDYLQIQFHGKSSSRTLLFILFKRFRLVRFCFCCCYCCCCFVETKEKTFSLIKMTSITRLLVQIQAINRVHNQGWWTWITRCFPALISTGIRQVTHQSTNQSTLVLAAKHPRQPIPAANVPSNTPSHWPAMGFNSAMSPAKSPAVCDLFYICSWLIL